MQTTKRVFMRFHIKFLFALLFFTSQIFTVDWIGPFPYVKQEEVEAALRYVGDHKVKSTALFVTAVLLANATKDWWLTPIQNMLKPEPCPVCMLNAAKQVQEKESSGGQDSMLSNFQKSRARVYKPGEIRVKFSDVAGLENAKEDVLDIVNFLRNPKIFKDMGAKIPKGILMSGPPGNGKTMLAKAIAGEVECPFLSISASEFMEAIVGIGAARVRDLFTKAKELAPCIIFIDEFDVVGKKRSSHSMGGGSDEQAQTLAQLLVEMDGFDVNQDPIIIIAATNRPDVLDSAIRRPGRFDREVEIKKPLLADRVKILNIHLKHVKIVEEIDVQRIARATGGFSGADLARLINDAAILAVNQKAKSVTMSHIDLAYDHITLGRETKAMSQLEFDLRSTAIHEAGHAIGYVFLQHVDPLHKVTITPRGGSLGTTHSLPLREKYSRSEQEMKERIIVSLAGGIAEQEFGYGKNTGVSSDLKHARSIAYDMVVSFGMTDELRYVSYDQIEHMLPNDTAAKVYDEMKKIIDECYEAAQKLVQEHKHHIEQLAELLLEKGTVYGNEVYEMFGLDVPAIDFTLS